MKPYVENADGALCWAPNCGEQKAPSWYVGLDDFGCRRWCCGGAGATGSAHRTTRKTGWIKWDGVEEYETDRMMFVENRLDRAARDKCTYQASLNRTVVRIGNVRRRSYTVELDNVPSWVNMIYGQIGTELYAENYDEECHSWCIVKLDGMWVAYNIGDGHRELLERGLAPAITRLNASSLRVVAGSCAGGVAIEDVGMGDAPIDLSAGPHTHYVEFKRVERVILDDGWSHPVNEGVLRQRIVPKAPTASSEEQAMTATQPIIAAYAKLEALREEAAEAAREAAAREAAREAAAATPAAAAAPAAEAAPRVEGRRTRCEREYAERLGDEQQRQQRQRVQEDGAGVGI